MREYDNGGLNHPFWQGGSIMGMTMLGAVSGAFIVLGIATHFGMGFLTELLLVLGFSFLGACIGSGVK